MIGSQNRPRITFPQIHKSPAIDFFFEGWGCHISESTSKNDLQHNSAFETLARFPTDSSRSIRHIFWIPLLVPAYMEWGSPVFEAVGIRSSYELSTKTLLICCFLRMILPSYIATVLSHYKDPCKPICVM